MRRALLARMTVDELCTSVLNRYRVEGRRSAGSVEYRTRCHVRRLLGHVVAETLDSPDLDAYVVRRQSEGAANGTIMRELAIVRRGFTLHRKALGPPPLFPNLKEAAPREGLWTVEEFTRLANDVAPWARPPLHFAYLTGWRLRSEVLPTRWTAVRFDLGGVTLPWGQSKNGDPRVFPFAGPIGEQLRALLERQRAATPAGCEWVFNHDGQRVVSIRETFENARRRLGLDGKLPHDLRRTAMVNLVNRGGMSIEQARFLTGHRDPNVARRYNLHVNDDLRRAMEATTRIELPAL